MTTSAAEQLIPDEGLSPGERSFRAAWFTNFIRTDAGRPQLTADFVSRQGRALRAVDLREADALLGELGHIPGTDWIPHADAAALSARVKPWEPLVLVCEDGKASAELALELEGRGLRLVAAMQGGMRGWGGFGLSPSRNAAVLSRRGELSAPYVFAIAEKRALKLDEVQDHLGHPATVRWIKVAALLVHARLSCVDGRDHTGVVGTPGGDAGEFLLGLAALESLLGKRLDDDAFEQLFRRRLDAFGRFAMHTDTHAGDRLIAAMRADERTAPGVAGLKDPLHWRAFFARPPAEYRAAIVELMVKPAHLGCGHLRLMTENPAAYGCTEGSVERLLSAVLRHRWNGAPEIEITPLPGGHAEGAVVNIRVAGHLEAFSRIPLVAPTVKGRQMFVNHPDVARYLRRQFALFLSVQDDLFPCGDGFAEKLQARMAELHGQQLSATLGKLAAGLPIFDATVDRGGKVEVRELGHV